MPNKPDSSESLEHSNIILGGDVNANMNNPSGSIETATEHFTIIAGCDKGYGDKDKNEDRVYINAESGLYVVVDGMGGYKGGDIAAEIISEELEKLPNDPQKALENAKAELQKHFSKKDSADAVVSLVKIYDSSSEQPKLETMHIGDARVLVLSKDGTIKHQTFDHSQSEEIVTHILGHSRGTPEYEKALINHPQRNIVSASVKKSDIEISDSIPLEEGDIYLVFSGGISDNLTNLEIAEIVKTSSSIQEAYSTIEQITRERMTGIDSGRTFIGGNPKKDNRSLIIGQYKPSSSREENASGENSNSEVAETGDDDNLNLRDKLEEGLLSPSGHYKSPDVKGYKVALRAQILTKINNTILPEGLNKSEKARKLEEISQTVFVDFTIELLSDLLEGKDDSEKVQLLEELLAELEFEGDLPEMSEPPTEDEFTAFYTFIAEYLRDKYSFNFIRPNWTRGGDRSVLDKDGAMSTDLVNRLRITYSTYNELFPENIDLMETLVRAFEEENGRPPYTKKELFSCYDSLPPAMTAEKPRNKLVKEFESNLKYLYQVIQNFDLYLQLKNPVALQLHRNVTSNIPEDADNSAEEFKKAINSILTGCDLLYRNTRKTKGNNLNTYYLASENPIWVGSNFKTKKDKDKDKGDKGDKGNKDDESKTDVEDDTGDKDDKSKEGVEDATREFDDPLFNLDSYHKALEEGDNSSIESERKARLFRIRSKVKDDLKANFTKDDLNTPKGRRKAVDFAFDRYMQANNQLMIDRQKYRLSQQGSLEKGFNKLRNIKPTWLTQGVKFAVTAGVLVGAGALMGPASLGFAATSFTLSTLALRKVSSELLVRGRMYGKESKMSDASIYENLATAQQFNIRKTIPGTPNDLNSLDRLDNSIYQSQQDKLNRAQTELKSRVSQKLSISKYSSILKNPTLPEDDKFEVILEVIHEEQEQIFKQLEAERDKLWKIRAAEFIGAAAMAGAVSLAISGISSLLSGGSSTAPVSSGESIPDPTPTTGAEEAAASTIASAEVEALGSFTGDFSTAQSLYNSNPTGALIDAANPQNLTEFASSVNPSSLANTQVQVLTEHSGSAGNLLFRDLSDINNVIGRFTPGTELTLTGETGVFNVAQRGTADAAPMRMFQVTDATGRTGWVSGAYLRTR